MAKNNKGVTPDDSDDFTDADRDALKNVVNKERESRREAEKAAKEARDELDKLKSSSDSSKSEIEKLTEQVTKLTERAEESERRVTIADIAEQKGLSVKQARRLTGKTREELEADADDLIELFGIKKSDKDDDDDSDSEDGKGGDSKARPPVKDLKSGSVPNAAAGSKSGNELADEVWKRTHGGV